MLASEFIVGFNRCYYFGGRRCCVRVYLDLLVQSFGVAHRVGLRACIHRDECAYVFVSVCVCIVFLKKLLKPMHIPLGNGKIENQMCMHLGNKMCVHIEKACPQTRIISLSTRANKTYSS